MQPANVVEQPNNDITDGQTEEDYYDQLLKKVDGTLEKRSMERSSPDSTLMENGAGMPVRNLRQKGAVMVDDLEYTRGYRICFWIPAVLPDQALLYVSDPENLPYLNSSIDSVCITDVKQVSNDIQHLTLALKYRKMLGICCASKETAKYIIKRKSSQFECITERATLQTHHVYTFVAEDGGCRVITMVSTNPQSNGCWRRMFLRRIRDQDVRSLQRLKKILEENDLALAGNNRYNADSKDPLLHVNL
mmetsp:Transcript_25449/g.33232  ORF Transcript_25449/g.33232 Transcript_25449/m.33232 type:complete len:248 (-) Transcript_25449:238-981(-)|eukprot:CAMPEP_0117762260 /NCGR_PEP_ID=MMETSP0947-20121206/17820_1 /TAXON_ID=44440 /ORGANISM="Chattonella subsalsa, Strain CCMP2191" /LENGTH=247 /DNA_ID=CAMNT_0005583509 /DNA_START=95 /DNA_END=838 /DNA_ORIENTATION=-